MLQRTQLFAVRRLLRLDGLQRRLQHLLLRLLPQITTNFQGCGLSPHPDTGWACFLQSVIINSSYGNIKTHFSYEELFSEIYFYHDYTGKEIDFLIRKENKIEGIEVKWDKEGKKVSKSLLSQFPDSEIKIIDHKEAYKFCL